MKIKFLKKNEIYKFQKLVEKHFPKKNHIFVKNTKVINFYYNFSNLKKIKILGLFYHKKLVAAQGLITMDNWDKNIKKHWHLAFTVKSKDYKKDCLILFLNYVFNLKPKFLGTVGTNMSTAGMVLNKLSKIKNLDHYYIVNPIIKNKISKNLIKNKIKSRNTQNIKMLINKKIHKLPKTIFAPKKTKKYFVNKYLNNPFYDYFLMNFYENKKLLFFFVFREIFIKSINAKVIRIVDFYGNFPNNKDISQNIIVYLIKKKIEYLDFLVGGLDNKILKKIGFNKKEKKMNIPNHFEPLNKKSHFLNYGIFLNKNIKKTLVFKGDGDQDRPSILKKL